MAVERLEFEFWVWDKSDIMGDPLGELTDAKGKRFRQVDQGVGEGRFVINANSDQADWCKQRNYVRVFYAGDDPAEFEDAVGGFWLEPGRHTLLTPDEKAGQNAAWGGRGSMAMMELARLRSTSALANGGDLGALPEDDPDNMWHWTRPPGAILVRQLEEAQARGMWSWVLASEFWDFSRSLDSNGDPWTGDPDPPEVKFPVGMDLLTFIGKLQMLGLFVYQHPGTFDFHAWDVDQGVTRTIEFGDEPDDIVGTVERDIRARGVVSNMEVAGDTKAGKTKFRTVDDSGVESDVGERIEGYLDFESTPTNHLLDRAGQHAIDQLKRAYDGPAVLTVVPKTDEIPFRDYMPGDYVTVTVPGEYGFSAYEAKVQAIALAELEDGRAEVVVQFAGDDPVEMSGNSSPRGNPCGGCPCRTGEAIPDTSPSAYLGEFYVGGIGATNPLSGGTGDLVYFVDQSATTRMPFIEGSAIAVNLTTGATVPLATQAGGTGVGTVDGQTGNVIIMARTACNQELPEEG